MKKTKGIVLALITAQRSCEQIIRTAEQYAETLNCSLTVLTAQPLKTSPESRSKDMICLSQLSKTTNKNIKIIYSDDPLKAVIKHSVAISPVHIFMGQGGEKSEFLTKLRICVSDAPISVVGKDGIIFSLGSLDNTLNIQATI